MANPDDLKYTSYLSLLFTSFIAVVFLIAEYPTLFSWVMLIGGFFTATLRTYAVYLKSKQSIQIPDTENLTEQNRKQLQELIRNELKQIKEQNEDVPETPERDTDQNTDASTSRSDDSGPTERTDEDRDFETEMN